MAGFLTVADNRNLSLTFSSGVAVSRFDLMYWDASAQLARNLTQKATLGSESLDQADVARNFLGASVDQLLATEAAGQIRNVQTDGVVDYDCVSQTFNLGDLVGPTWFGGAALVNQAVTKVPFLQLAIGIVTANVTTAVTRVRFRLISRVAFDLVTAKLGTGGGQGAGSLALADATQTLLENQLYAYLSMPASAARTVTLPAEAQSTGIEFKFSNTGTASVTFAGVANAVRGNAVVPTLKNGFFYCDGTYWYGVVSA